MFDPREGNFVPLQRASEDIKHLDIDHKITELTNIDYTKLIPKLELSTQWRANQLKLEVGWFDVRGIALTAATQKASELGAQWILKIDSDQAVYLDAYKLKHHLEIVNGYKFHQYEFSGTLDYDNAQMTERQPDDPYNDSVFVYRSMMYQFYGGGGCPDLHLPGTDRTDTDLFHCAHMRSANPSWWSEDEKLAHFYGRQWFGHYTNDIGEFCSRLDRRSLQDARTLLERDNLIQAYVKPPEVLNFREPLDYIRMYK
jgi:hypothetical protein